jgi:hypothetical protein
MRGLFIQALLKIIAANCLSGPPDYSDQGANGEQSNSHI